MKHVFKTKSGSTYILDDVEMTWRRESDHRLIGAPNRESGKLLGMPSLHKGESVYLRSPNDEWVLTTPIVEMWTE